MKKLGKLKLVEILTSDEKKLIVGGSGISYKCERSNNNYGSGNFFVTESKEVANAWCDFWLTAGYQCECYPLGYIEC